MCKKVLCSWMVDWHRHNLSEWSYQWSSPPIAVETARELVNTVAWCKYSHGDKHVQ